MSRRPHPDEEPDSSSFKRLKTWDAPSARLSPDDYSIAWICALPLELEASRAMLDEEHPSLHSPLGDDNIYVLGHIGQHNVVMACLPGQYGTNNAAIVATNLKRSFLGVRSTLMVGIGGGAPDATNDLRLGDIVVGTRVMQYDLGKNVGDGKFQTTAVPTIPSRRLLAAVSTLRSMPTRDGSRARVTALLQTKLSTYVRPNHPDQLFQASYEHPSDAPSCHDCDPSRLEQRRVRAINEPKIHYGGIASANTVMKNARARDNIARELSIMCFEMEAAGIMDNQCLPIRGICDYSDSHKNKAWQGYAAAAAAAYARELLEALPHALEERTRAQTWLGTSSDHTTAVDQTSERREQLLESLSFSQLDARMTNVQRAHFQTCRWFLRHPKYQDWLDPRKQSQTHGFLWIVGKAGAGKSTIMKFAYLETKRKSKDPGKPVASFFFNARGDVLERSVAGMYRSLLLQLLKTYPDLQAILDDPDIVPSNQTECPGINILKEAFRSATTSLDRRPFTCFVDALDECDEQEVRDMVQFFEELAEETTADDIQFRVCFSSRPYPYIDIRPEVLLILEKEDGHAEDLSRYVESRLKITSHSLLSDLKLRILEKAAGIFMWIVLVVDILNKENHDGALALGKRLEKIPSKLSDLFKSILTRDQHQVDRLLLCVLWVLCAKRPLTPAEFRHALWAGLLNHDLVDDALPENTAADAAKLVTSSSKGLAEITKSKQPTVQFIHESVRDFLVKENGLRDLWPDLGLEWEAQAHEKLRHSCFTYLSLPDVQPILERLGDSDKEDEEGVPAERYPFLEYASQQVLHHSDAAADVVSQDDFISRFFSSNGIRWLNLFEKAKIRQYSKSATPLYVLADRGLANLVRKQMKRGPSTRTEERYEYPFFAALAGGHDRAVAVFLGLPSIIKDGIDLTKGLKNRQDLPKSSFTMQTPLSWAAREGRLGIVKALVEAGEDVNLRSPNLFYHFEQAIFRQHFDVAFYLLDSGAHGKGEQGLRELNLLLRVASEANDEARVCGLIEKGADTHTQDEEGNTALHLALRAGNETIARLLIEKGADLDAVPFDYNTALHLALKAGSETVARLLIENSANIHARDKNGSTALHLASEDGRESMVQLLIDKGANIHAEDYGGNTALHIASKAEKKSVVRFLIEAWADVDASNRDGQTALHFAARADDKTVAQILIDNGADANASCARGLTALMHASWAGHEAVVQCLIEGKAAIDAVDSRGRTALMIASESGREAVVRLLLKNSDTNVNAQDDMGRTALAWASFGGWRNPQQSYWEDLLSPNSIGLGATVGEEMFARIARFLIEEGGAEVDSRDRAGCTPLMLASRFGQRRLIELLLEKGADISPQNNEGATALDLAQKARRHEAAEILERATR